MSNLLQVMSLMAVPVVILGTIGYLNRRANRRPITATGGSAGRLWGSSSSPNAAP